MVVAPPLLFFAGSTCAELITAPGTFLAAEGILVTLGTSAPWLFTGTALTVVVAIGRGYRPAFRRPGGSFRARCGRAPGELGRVSSAGTPARGGRPGGR